MILGMINLRYFLTSSTFSIGNFILVFTLNPVVSQGTNCFNIKSDWIVFIYIIIIEIVLIHFYKIEYRM